MHPFGKLVYTSLPPEDDSQKDANGARAFIGKFLRYRKGKTFYERPFVSNMNTTSKMSIVPPPGKISADEKQKYFPSENVFFPKIIKAGYGPDSAKIVSTIRIFCFQGHSASRCSITLKTFFYKPPLGGGPVSIGMQSWAATALIST